MNQTLKEITESFKQISDDNVKANIVVLILHDLTGVKKKDIKKILKYGPLIEKAYTKDQSFTVNKKAVAKLKDMREDDFDLL